MKKYSKIISFMVVMATIVTLLSGCGEIKKAETVVRDTLDALKSLDFETASNYINIDEIMKAEDSDSSLDFDSNIFMENLFGKIDYKIISSEKTDENTVVVKTEITAIDMKPVLSDFLAKALQYAFSNAFANPQPSEEETNAKMEEIFVECISKEDLAKITNEVDINVVKVEGKWKIEAGETLSNALLGGLAKAAEEISNSFNVGE